MNEQNRGEVCGDLASKELSLAQGLGKEGVKGWGPGAAQEDLEGNAGKEEANVCLSTEGGKGGAGSRSKSPR